MRLVLIDTQWDVNMTVEILNIISAYVLIDTQWNVNEAYSIENVIAAMF